ncbi:MAG: galactokinase [Opitutales bacterium]
MSQNALSDTQPVPAPALLETAKAFFEECWEKPAHFAAVAPGRVNLIGEHVDYNGGWVLPAAIERHLVLALRARDDGRIRLRAKDFEGETSFALGEHTPGAVKGWGRYVQGVIAGLTEAGVEVPCFDAIVVSNLPIGGGLSSSAALEAATALGVLALAGREMDRWTLSKLCQAAEHRYAGVPCGIMDQASILNCRAGHLLFLDCAEETFTHAPFEASDWALMIINSKVAHELAGGEYAQRRAACEAAARTLGVESLRAVAAAGLDDALALPELDERMRRCVRHVVTENARTHRTVEALAAGDMAAAGRELNASHASLRDDYLVSCRELDFIAATAQALDGVAGCRMTGGGFGGSAIALVRRDRVEDVEQQLAAAYTAEFGFAPGIFLTAPAAGAAVYAVG